MHPIIFTCDPIFKVMGYSSHEPLMSLLFALIIVFISVGSNLIYQVIYGASTDIAKCKGVAQGIQRYSHRLIVFLVLSLHIKI